METRYITTPTISNGSSFTRLDVCVLLQRHSSFLLNPLLFSATNETSFYPLDNSYQVHRISRSQPITINAHSIQPVSRPLSSADEGGPVPKKLRSTSRQPEPLKPKPMKSLDDPLKKARARPALSFANIFSFSGSQSITSSRANPPPGKNNTQPTAGVGTRRSTRLLSGTGAKSHSSKVICSISPYETSSCYNILPLASSYTRSTATATFPKSIDGVRQGRRCHTQW
jgi:hypothetical protein